MPPLRPQIRPVGTLPSKTVKAPAPVPGIAVPKVVSQIAKIQTAGATGTRVKITPVRTGRNIPPIQLRRLQPKQSPPVVAGAMPRRVWTNPTVAAPANGRPGAGVPSHVREVGRGRVVTRNTR